MITPSFLHPWPSRLEHEPASDVLERLRETVTPLPRFPPAFVTGINALQQTIRTLFFT